MTSVNVPIAKPSFDSSEEQAILEVLRSGWVSQGKKGVEFEQAIANYTGARYAKAVNSGTGAIHLALLACGVKPGDQVIVPAFTCVAALHPIECIGAEPVLADIELETFGIDPANLLSAITPRTRAIMVTHLFGLAARIFEVMALASDRSIAVIEDAALGLGAKVENRSVGTFGAASCLSFHPRKMITTGEGGMVLTNSAAIADAVARLRNYGASVSALERHQGKLYELPAYDEVGFNFKMTDLQAAVGVEQSRKLPALIEARRAIARRYNSELGSLEWLKLPVETVGSTHAYQSYVCLIAPDQRAIERVTILRYRFMDHLAGCGVACVQAAQAMPAISFYHRKYGWDPGKFPNSLRADAASVALPIYPGMMSDDVGRVIEAVRSFKA
jgi:dTDP-4-amino-4,6-dideoxygalactose transaminase